MLTIKYASLLLLVALLHSSARADFDTIDIDDSFSLRVGDTAVCPEKIEIDGGTAPTSIGAEELEVEEEKCSGSGKIELVDNEDSTPGTKWLLDNEEDIGDFFAGNVTEGDITCKPSGLKLGEQILLVQPEDDITVKFDTMFGTTTSVGAGQSEYDLDDDIKYLFVGSRCLYSETKIADRVCFPADAQVHMAHDQVKSMKHLQIGDSVVVDHTGRTERILGFSHADSTFKTRFFKLTLEQDKGQFVASIGHFIPVWESPQHDSQLLAMENVKVGMFVRHLTHGLVKVAQKNSFMQKGVWNPHTSSGSIVVDGVVATCYTKATGSPSAGHALLTPFRNHNSVCVRKVSALVLGLVDRVSAAF